MGERIRVGSKIGGAKQRDVIITPEYIPPITVDNIEVSRSLRGSA
jgi:hypothetical protein